MFNRFRVSKTRVCLVFWFPPSFPMGSSIICPWDSPGTLDSSSRFFHPISKFPLKTALQGDNKANPERGTFYQTDGLASSKVSGPIKERWDSRFKET